MTNTELLSALSLLLRASVAPRRAFWLGPFDEQTWQRMIHVIIHPSRTGLTRYVRILTTDGHELTKLLARALGYSWSEPKGALAIHGTGFSVGNDLQRAIKQVMDLEVDYSETTIL